MQMISPAKKEFIEFMMSADVLRFGEFTTKSGRLSPYFVNTGNYRTGAQIATLGKFYAQCIMDNCGDNFDAMFGPAYKGIPLGVSTAIALTSAHGMEVGYTFDRKEKKDHGDGGMMVGTQLADGMKVLLVDDVMTAGTAVREVIPKLKAEANVEVVGLVLSVDRMEKTKDSDMSAVKAVEAEFGFPGLSIAVLSVESLAAELRDDQRFVGEHLPAERGGLLRPRGIPPHVFVDSHDIQQRAAAYLEEYGA